MWRNGRASSLFTMEQPPRARKVAGQGFRGVANLPVSARLILICTFSTPVAACLCLDEDVLATDAGRLLALEVNVVSCSVRDLVKVIASAEGVTDAKAGWPFSRTRCARHVPLSRR